VSSYTRQKDPKTPNKETAPKKAIVLTKGKNARIVGREGERLVIGRVKEGRVIILEELGGEVIKRGVVRGVEGEEVMVGIKGGAETRRTILERTETIAGVEAKNALEEMKAHLQGKIAKKGERRREEGAKKQGLKIGIKAGREEKVGKGGRGGNQLKGLAERKGKEVEVGEEGANESG